MSKQEILDQIGELSEQMMEKFEVWDDPEKGTLLGWYTMLIDIYEQIQESLCEKGE